MPIFTWQYCMTMSIQYVMLRASFHHQPHHKQNYNVHLHGKITVTQCLFKRHGALSLRNAHISRMWLMRLRRPFIQWAAVHTMRKLVLQRPVRPEQPASPLQVWLDHAIAGLPLRPEIQPTNIVVMLQLRHCILLHPCQTRKPSYR